MILSRQGDEMITWIQILIVVAAAGVGVGISYFYPGAKDDNPIEEKCEEIIKKNTGADIDLTPRSPESNKDK